jgi:hypothetical protein
MQWGIYGDLILTTVYPFYIDWKNNNARRTSTEAFLKKLAANLGENDVWLAACNVRWFDKSEKFKPTPRACYGFVLKRLAASIDKVVFDPADSTHLDELTDTAVARLFKKVSEAPLIGERTGIELILLSHSGMGMLSLDRENSDLAVNAPGQFINVDCIGFQRYPEFSIFSSTYQLMI